MKISAGKFLAVVFLFSLLVAAQAEAIEFKAEKVDYNMETSETVLEENVVIGHEGKHLISDRAKINVNTNQAYAEGTVLLISKDEIYLIEHVDYNFEKEFGVGGKGTTYKYPWIIEGERIEKRGDDLIVEDATFKPSTTTDTIVSFKAKKVVLEDNKYLIVKNLVKYVGKVPVFWFPYIKKDITDQRNNLNITPGKNSLYGLYVKASYRYWFLPEVFGRAHLDYFEDRGLGLGLDFELEEKNNKGYFQSYYIEDKDYDTDRTDDIQGIKEDRYGVNLRSSHLLPESWLMSLSANKQSDLQFYDDFFYDDFLNEVQKQNQIALSKNVNNISFNGYFETRLNDFFTVLERKPELTFDYNNYHLEDYNVFHKFKIEGAEFNLKYADDSVPNINESRFYMSNELSYPMKYFGWMNIRPELVMENAFYSEGLEVEGETEDNILRNVFTGEIDFFFKMYKAMYPSKKKLGFERFRHVFEPHITYTYRPDPNYINAEVNQLDNKDLRPEINRFYIDLRNILQAKNGETGPVFNLLTGSFFIYYDILENDFSNIGFNWDFRLTKNFSLDMKGYISKEGEGILTSDIDLAYYHNDILGASMGWIYRKDSSNFLSPEVYLNVTDDVYLRGLVRYDYEKDQTEYSQASIVKQAKGYNLAFQYRNRNLRNDETYMIVVSLTDYPRANIALK